METTTTVKKIDASKCNRESMRSSKNNYNASEDSMTPTSSPNVSKEFFKAANRETRGVSSASSNGKCDTDGNCNGNGAHPSPPNVSTPRADAPPPPSRGRGRPLLFRSLRFLLLNGPLLACWSMLLATVLVKEVWDGPLVKLLKSFKLNDDSSTYLGTYSELDHELTYYHRRCDHRDISTHDANDLLVDPGMTHKERQDIVMTHGAAVMKNMISDSTARELRSYLETKHHKFHSENLELPWDELFWDGDGGSRLSLGLGPEDASIVSRAITEVGSNSELKKTLEAILGTDPAVVEVSTLSTMHDADPQGIHTDSDWFGSSVLYTRSFLHSYTMFISLQDTTSRMGATTICPGTHWCADEDLEDLCQCNFLDDDDDEEEPIGYCNTFEASSNGKTGLDVGVLQTGDAMMFNQNVWHRGPRNFDAMRKENRAMFIMTFLTRRDYEKGDNRQQGWGTYYYMRHSMWGHLFSDLKTAASGGMDLFKQRIWKAYGLVGASRSGNLPWLEHWARQMSNNMDFFADSELEEFQIMLRELTKKNRLADWLFLDDDALKHLFGDEYYNEDDEISWENYLQLLVEGAFYQSKRLYFTVAVATVLANGVGYALYCVFWWILRWAQRPRGVSSPPSSFDRPKPVRDASRIFGTILAGHLLVFGIGVATRHYVLYKAPLFERIHNGDINFKSFPPLPVQKDGNGYEYEVPPVALLIDRQVREQREFQLEHPMHPYIDYFEREYDRLEKAKRTSDYLVPKSAIPDVPQLPIQESAFPERNDVLIGSRFDANFLASMNLALYFHPGTKEWIALMIEHQRGVSDTADEAYLSMAVETVVWKILDTNEGTTLSLLSNQGGTPRRFLKQDHETGWWVVMTSSEACAITRRALLALARPKSVGVAYDHWKQVLADSRFGKHRHTALATKWIPQRVEKMTQELFVREISTDETKTIVSPIASAAETKKRLVTKGLGRILLPSTGRGLLPKSMVTGKTALSPSGIPLLPPTILPYRVHLRKLGKGMVTLKIGDHILYKGRDDEELFYQATIVSIETERNMLEIQPLRIDEGHDFGDLTIDVHISGIQFYKPPQEGDTVWALTIDHNVEDEESWKIYEVLFLTPFGHADLLMTDEYVEEYEEEGFENRPIGLDYKQFFLTENRVPSVRLRQY